MKKSGKNIWHHPGNRVDKDEMYSRDPRDFPAPGGDREREHAHEPVFHRYLQVEN